MGTIELVRTNCYRRLSVAHSLCYIVDSGESYNEDGEQLQLGYHRRVTVLWGGKELEVRKT